MNENNVLEQLNLLKNQVSLLKNENERLKKFLKEILNESLRTINLLN